MNFTIANNNFISVNKEKNDLYVCNTNIRNLARALEFLELAKEAKKVGVMNNQSFLQFIEDSENQVLTTASSKSLTVDENKVQAYARRFSELNLVGLCNFTHKDGEFNFEGKKSNVFEFDSKLLNSDKTSIDYRETLSNCVLYVLKARNTLNTVFSLFSELSKTQPEDKNLYLTNCELAYIYTALPVWKKSYKNQTNYAISEIKALRHSFDKIKDYATLNSIDSLTKLSYKNFLAAQSEILVKNSKLNDLVKFDTATSYIDMTVRTLIQSGCFTKVEAKENQLNSVGIKVNENFESKLVFFIQNSFDELKELYATNNLKQSLEDFEKFYLSKKTGVNVVSDTVEQRYKEVA